MKGRVAHLRTAPCRHTPSALRHGRCQTSGFTNRAVPANLSRGVRCRLPRRHATFPFYGFVRFLLCPPCHPQKAKAQAEKALGTAAYKAKDFETALKV